jgi:hypothetical protein
MLLNIQANKDWKVSTGFTYVDDYSEHDAKQPHGGLMEMGTSWQ